MIEFVLLDLDDTLLDFHRAEAEALKKTLLHFGIPPTDTAVSRYSAINDAQWKKLEREELTIDEVRLRRFELFFAEFGIDRPAEEAKSFYESRLSEGHWFMEGAEALLAALHGKYRLFLVSNGIVEVQESRVASAGIAGFFDGIFFSESVGAAKPKKEFFDVCFAAIPGFDRTRAVIIGDSPTSDILGGRNAGILTCLYNPKGKPPHPTIKPDYTIAALDEFPHLLKKL